MRPPSRTFTLGAALAAILAVPCSEASELFGTEGVPETLLARVLGEDRVVAIAFDARAERAAIAADSTGPKPRDRSRTLLKLLEASGVEPRELELQGRNLDLLFSPDGRSLFLLQHVPDRPGPPVTELIEIAPELLDRRRTLHVSAGARSLAVWPERSLLLVIGDDEIRAHDVVDLHSGPVYRIPGANTSALAIGGSRFLLGRNGGLALADLDDPPRDYATPLREEAVVSSAVSLTAIGTPSLVLARSADGLVFEVALAPLGPGRVLGPGLLVRRTRSEPLPRREVAPSAPAVVSPSRAEVPAPAAAAAEPPPAPAAALDVPPSAQIAGRVSGEGARAVVAVVLWGPDNILREATRLAPGTDGHWWVAGLPAGRYRIQLDGGAQVLSSSPQFHSVVVVDGATPIVVEFVVSGSR